MSQFALTDFAPLEDFPLLWRWTQPAYDLLPTPVLATIRPLTAAAAGVLGPEAAQRCRARTVREFELSISAEWDDPAAVRDRLEALRVDVGGEVIVSWDRSTAVVTIWGTFVRYWDAFCYPSADDVTVWAPREDWTLCYRHFRVIEFGRFPRAT